MSDMLGRLHARARGSDLCLHRRAHFRFAPVVGTLNEGEAGIADPLADPLAAALDAGLDDSFTAGPSLSDADMLGDAPAIAVVPREPSSPAAPRRRVPRGPRGARKRADAGGTPLSDDAAAEMDLEGGAEPENEPAWPTVLDHQAARAPSDAPASRDGVRPSRGRRAGASDVRGFGGLSANSEATVGAPRARKAGARSDRGRDGVALPGPTAWPGEIDGTSPGVATANEAAASPDARTTPRRPVEDGSSRRSGMAVSIDLGGFETPKPLGREIAPDRSWARVADPERPVPPDGPPDAPDAVSAPDRDPSPLPAAPSDRPSRDRVRRLTLPTDQAIDRIASTLAGPSPAGARTPRLRPGRASNLGASTRPRTSSATSPAGIETTFEEKPSPAPDTWDVQPAPFARPHDRARGSAQVFGRNPSGVHASPPRAPIIADAEDAPGLRGGGPDDHAAAPSPTARSASTERGGASVPPDRTAFPPLSQPADRRLAKGSLPAGGTDEGFRTDAREARSPHPVPDQSRTTIPPTALAGRRATLPEPSMGRTATSSAEAPRDPSGDIRAAAIHGRTDGPRQLRLAHRPPRPAPSTDASGSAGKVGEGRIVSRRAFGPTNGWSPEVRPTAADAAYSARPDHAGNDPEASDRASSETGTKRTRPNPDGGRRVRGPAAFPVRSVNSRAEHGTGPVTVAPVSTVAPMQVLGTGPLERVSRRPEAEAPRSAMGHASPDAADRSRIPNAGIVAARPQGEGPTDRAATPARKIWSAARDFDPRADGVTGLADIQPAPTSRHLPPGRIVQPRLGPAQTGIAPAGRHDAPIHAIPPAVEAVAAPLRARTAEPHGSRPGPDMTASDCEGHGTGGRAVAPARRVGDDARPVARDRAANPAGARTMRDVPIRRSEPDRAVPAQRPRPTRRPDHPDPAAHAGGSGHRSGDLRIEIGRIEVALPQARPAPQSRPQPPAFQAKPRGGPDA